MSFSIVVTERFLDFVI